MKKYDAVLVVEGKTDKDLIESFLDADIIMTNGSEVSRGTLYYIKEVSKTRTIVVLTDPDAPGKRIRDLVTQTVPEALNAYLPKEKCIKHHKVGVAESSKDVILEALDNLVPTLPRNDSELTYNDLFELGLLGQNDSSKKRLVLENKAHLGHTNGKSLLKRCKALGLTKKDLEDILNG
ncbi:MAG: ribonuclease M5 [Bacilli bacterium]|jgi:ribonuclease M5|nr:ribonuclease M5 [Bacilli bacterium]MCH4210397.1 ribonuclease M5 [Bacilli bacterium]MCH4228927.1 ribonuclease M5 [Bacilli bacterium]MCH4277553.1 ribonuclease M5 [Bacilli bacterium]MCI2055055.1 ribonuclease M5 [Bacilli bacterium]